MTKPLVSVIIPCYNQGEYLKDAVDSVLASTYDNIEIIVVNDGSTENADFLNTFSAPKLKIIHQENQGLSIARNNGIKEARGEYILPLDSDDKIISTYIEKAVKVFEKHEKMGIVYCDAEFFGEKSGKWSLETYNFPNILWTNMIFCSAMFKKSDWAICGGYKEEMCFGFEDWEFWLSLIESGVEVYKIPETLFLYRQNQISRSKKLAKYKKRALMLKQIIKFHPNLYIDNIETVVLHLHKCFELYAKQTGFIIMLRYKINNILRKLLIKNSIL